MADGQQIEVFRSLKPVCVRLSDEAIKIRSGKSNPRNVISSVEALLHVLESLVSSGRLIDQRLVDYVFFPLSHLFKDRDKFPVRSLELALHCVKILLQTGWRTIEDSNTGLQLLILLTHFAQDRDEVQNPAYCSNELAKASLECISELFQSLEPPQGSTSLLFSSSNVPTVGYAITIILDKMKYGASAEMQVSAANALRKFVDCGASREVLQSFVPGIFSALSFVLTPDTKHRRPYQLLEIGLFVLRHCVQLVLSDIERAENMNERNKKEIKYVDDGWCRATAAQTKLVLANVVRLRQHNRSRVREALRSLCWTILEHCPITMSDSVPMILETIIALSSMEEERSQLLHLQRLVDKQPIIGQNAKSSIYESLISLPRAILANEDAVREKVTSHIASLILVLAEASIDMTMIDNLLYQNIRESLSNLYNQETRSDTTGQFLLDFPEGEFSMSCETLPSEGNLLRDTPRRSAFNGLLRLIRSVSQRESGLVIANRALENFHRRSGELIIEDLWICFNLLQARIQERRTYVNTSNAALENEEENLIRNALYDLAISLLSQLDYENQRNWRVQVLCFEILAFQASQTKQCFRLELSEALYPVIHRLGSTAGPLRTSAMNCLNAMAFACGYSDVKEMIVGNADYVVNAVGLQLNALDITPQSCRVLLMMIKLCGGSLLPFIDDLVDGISNALKCYHGYSVLVEQLFAVLEAVILEGTKNLPTAQSIDIKKPCRSGTVCPQKIRAVVNKTKKWNNSLVQNVAKQETESTGNLPRKSPQQAWESLGCERKPERDATSPAGKSAVVSQPERGTFIPTNMYEMLQRIARLTQYHLPSSSAAVRTLLLSLLIRAVPFLSRHDDSFLPLVHTLWPILLPRLADKEAYVVAGVLDLMGCLCQGAGDFLSSRIDGVWPTIQRLYVTTETSQESTSPGSYRMLHSGASLQPKPNFTQSAITPLSSSLLVGLEQLEHQQVATNNPKIAGHSVSDLYLPTTTRMISNALSDFLVKMVSFTKISETIYFETLSQMLYSQLMKGHAPEMRKALANVNPDAVYFALEHESLLNLYSQDRSSAKVLSGGEMKTPENVAGAPEFVGNRV